MVVSKYFPTALCKSFIYNTARDEANSNVWGFRKLIE
jgi:hypothetical protein